MKKFTHKLFSFFMLIGFLYVQVPFTIFHHHDHKPVCELSDNSVAHTQADRSQKHFHENNTVHCFLCSAQLMKEYSVKDFSFSFSVAEVCTHYSFYTLSLSSPSLFSSHSR